MSDDLMAGFVPGAGAKQRCAWCGRCSERTRGPNAVLVPLPDVMRLEIERLEWSRGARILHDGYLEPAGTRSRWWCRGSAGCAKRRGGAATIEGA